MAYNRAFSDSEIVTIAAVAAAALGGIVVGLGRGQANAVQPSSTSERLRAITSTGLERAQEALPDRAKLADRAEQLQSRARQLPERGSMDSSPVCDALAALAENLKQADVNFDVSKWLPQLPETKEPAGTVRESARNVARAGGEKLPSRDQLSGFLAHLGSTLAASKKLPQQAQSNGDGRLHFAKPSVDASQIRERVEEALERAGEHLPTTDSADEARSRAGDAVQRHVAEPVSRAASATKDTTQEAAMALVWLGAGAALVYFGLLSSDRREQVKDFICGAFEQARLLALDFQGYETEM